MRQGLSALALLHKSYQKPGPYRGAGMRNLIAPTKVEGMLNLIRTSTALSHLYGDESGRGPKEGSKAEIPWTPSHG